MSMRAALPTVIAVMIGLLFSSGNELQSASQEVTSQGSSFVLFKSLQADDPWWTDGSNSHENDDPWWRGGANSYENDDPWWTGGPNSYESDDPWWTSGSNSYETDVPWWSDDACYGAQCEDSRVWWQDTAECFGSFCNDPWNGSTAGCSFGICDDDSFLVDCSYVTVGMMGAEGACNGPLGRTSFDNCYPVSGSGARSGLNDQTFRCVDGPGYQSGGYPLTDIAPMSDGDVTLLLCAEVSAFGVHSCEDAPAGIKHYTCEKDIRVMPPFGSEKDWYLCER